MLSDHNSSSIVSLRSVERLWTMSNDHTDNTNLAVVQSFDIDRTNKRTDFMMDNYFINRRAALSIIFGSWVGPRIVPKVKPIFRQLPDTHLQLNLGHTGHEGGSWPTAQGNWQSTRNAEGSHISVDTISNFDVSWSKELKTDATYGAITSNPIVYDGFVYFIDQMSNVACIALYDGSNIWSLKNDIPTAGPNGIAIKGSRLVAALGDSRGLQCLDRNTGRELWRTEITQRLGLGASIAPVIYGDHVFAGVSPGGTSNLEYVPGAGGSLFCVDLESGMVVWEWESTINNLWGHPEVNSGGGIWYPPSFDRKGTLYVGIGNPAPFPGTNNYPNASSRNGDNSYTNSLVAIDVNTGSVMWHASINPHDLYDHDNQLSPIIVEGEDKLGDSILIITSGKHGYVVACDHKSGEVVWRVAVGKHKNDGLHQLPSHFVEVFPGVFGGVLSPMAYSSGRVFVATINMSTEYSDTEHSISSFDRAESELVALNVVDGSLIWKVKIPSGVFGSGPTVSNDLVFVASLDGAVGAYRTSDGAAIWSTLLPSGINAPIAIAGDSLVIPAGMYVVPQSDTPSNGEPPAFTPSLVCLRLTK